MQGGKRIQRLLNHSLPVRATFIFAKAYTIFLEGPQSAQ